MIIEDAYRILDLEVGATKAEVKEQYKLLLQFYHPDKHTTEQRQTRTITTTQ